MKHETSLQSGEGPLIYNGSYKDLAANTQASLTLTGNINKSFKKEGLH